MVKYRAALSGTFAALSDPKRVAIVERLSRGEASSSELAGPLGLSLPAFAKHLQSLEDGGLVVTRKEGRVRKCRLSDKPLAEAETWIANRRDMWEQRLDALQDRLEERISK